MSEIELPGFGMHFVERGSGTETILFLHGFVSSHRWWLPALAELPEGYHGYALDFRACGDSEKVDTGHTLAQYAADVAAFVGAKGLDSFTLVAHSMGGGIGMLYALDHPKRLKALLLVSPMAPYGMRIDQATTDWLNQAQGLEKPLGAVVRGAFATPPASPYLEQLVADAVAWGQPAYRCIMDDMAAYSVSERLASFKVPTLVVWGDRDGVIPFVDIVETVNGIPKCGLDIWHGVGHSAPIERPKRFMALLKGFMDELASQRWSDDGA
jgi:branched-chain amino acid transport system permease protein